MDFNNSPFGKFIKSPLIRPIFTTDFDVDGNPSPPGSNFMITEGGDYMIVESNARMITE